jgi:spermidine/putrescine transport system ATP-binding protein
VPTKLGSVNIDEASTSACCAVELRNVSKHYGQTRALDAVSLQIERNEFFCLLGSSGCGKTTTLNIIGGFIPLTGGEVYIDGRPVANEPPYRRNVNTVFQNYALFPHMTVAQNIGFGLRMKKVPPCEIERAVADMLALVSLEWAGSRHSKQLSGGQQQRIALARALVNRPAVLLLDEPLGALDLKLRKQLQVELRNIQRRVGITFIHVTHDQEEAMSMSDRIAVMHEGKVVQVDSPSQIYYHPTNRFVADFIGESNFLVGNVVDSTGGDTVVDVPGFARPVRVHSATPAARGQKVTVMVRPEMIRVSPVEDAPDGNLGQGVLAKVSFLGMYTQLFVELGGVMIRVSSPNRSDVEAGWQSQLGKQVYLSWSPEDSNLFVDQVEQKGGEGSRRSAL